MSTDVSLYEFTETLSRGKIDPEKCNWMYYMGDGRFVYHAEVGKNGMPKEITEKLKKQGYKIGDRVLLIVDC